MSCSLKAIALYNFQPSAPVELELHKGDVIIVRNIDVGDGWSEGELHGKRGLFPKSFVQMLEEQTNGRSSPPLTPQSNKKLFMETLLTPTPNTIDDVFDEDTAAELFAASHNDIQISAGPKWSHKPPSLTITIADGPKQLRSSGIRLHAFYEVRTKELKVAVQRKYKHFLWLYDQLAEKCPCISLPPLPIKHGLPTDNDDEFKENRRRGLEKFLNRLARHPILGCTKVLQVFLIATDDKEWRIGAGKHSSFIKGVSSKGNKKLFSAPIFSCVHYPPYNVPLSQLSAFEKFSKFSETLESNVSALIRSCEMLKSVHGKMSRGVKSLGNDMQVLSRGGTPSGGGGRLIRKPSQGISLPTSSNHSISAAESGEETDEIEQELPNTKQWNWREDENFSKLMIELEIIGDKMRHVAIQHTEHQDKLEVDVIEGLEEYLSIIHTLPVLVKKHEEAMTAFNACKEKGSKKEAETMRQECETLNNILLSELDYFSCLMIEDFQGIFLKLLKSQADYHRKIALEWESMYDSFYENRPVRRAAVKRSVTIPGSKLTKNNGQYDTVNKRPASTDTETPPPIIARTYKTNGETNEPQYNNTDHKSVQYENVLTYSTVPLIEQQPSPLIKDKGQHDNMIPVNTSSLLPKPIVNTTGDEVGSNLICTNEEPKEISPAAYSPRMHTKLAKLTKLPSTTSRGMSSSFSQGTSRDLTTKKLTTRTLPRKTPPPLDSSQNSEESSELFQKLQQRRQKIESQLLSDKSEETGVLRWTRDSNSDSNNLSKFGIIEEGGTYTV